MATSHTAPQLRSRIADICSSIDLQRQVLKDLEKQKNEAQSQLNALLNPMGRLPVEVSAEIFMECLSWTPTMDPDIAPVVFTEVCRAWRKLAISIPSLWTSLTDKDVAPRKFNRFLSNWAFRARRLPISLCLDRSLAHIDWSSLSLYAHKIQTLELHPASNDVLFGMTHRYSALTSLTVARNLTTEGAFMPFWNAMLQRRMGQWGGGWVCVYLLHKGKADEGALHQIGRIMQHLRLGHDTRLCTAVFLQYLTLPALEIGSRTSTLTTRIWWPP